MIDCLTFENVDYFSSRNDDSYFQFAKCSGRVIFGAGKIIYYCSFSNSIFFIMRHLYILDETHGVFRLVVVDFSAILHCVDVDCVVFTDCVDAAQ